MNFEIKELDVVALLRDQPEAELVKGQVGTVVEKLGETTYEVEFSDDDGRAYAICAIKEEDLMLLHYAQIEAA